MTPRQIINKYLSSNAGRATSGLFHDWFANSRDRQAKDEALQDFWEQVEGDRSNAEASFNVLKKRIMSNRRKSFFRIILATAAAAVILIVPAVSVHFLRNAEPAVPQNVEIQECFAANGSTSTVFLPDSTKVILNSGSILLYPERFTAGERKVYLNGEAIFKVTKDREKPFKVKTDRVEVRVIGTEFNLKAYPEDKKIEIIVKEGSVGASVKGFDECVLIPGEKMTYDSGKGYLIKETVVPDAYFAWSDGKLYFSSETFHDIIPVIERRFGVEVNFATNKYDNERITAKFISGESIDDLLATFCALIPGMKYKKTENGIIVY